MGRVVVADSDVFLYRQPALPVAYSNQHPATNC